MNCGVEWFVVECVVELLCKVVCYVGVCVDE